MNTSNIQTEADKKRRAEGVSQYEKGPDERSEAAREGDKLYAETYKNLFEAFTARGKIEENNGGEMPDFEALVGKLKDANKEVRAQILKHSKAFKESLLDWNRKILDQKGSRSGAALDKYQKELDELGLETKSERSMMATEAIIEALEGNKTPKEVPAAIDFGTPIEAKKAAPAAIDFGPAVETRKAAPAAIDYGPAQEARTTAPAPVELPPLAAKAQHEETIMVEPELELNQDTKDWLAGKPTVEDPTVTISRPEKTPEEINFGLPEFSKPGDAAKLDAWTADLDASPETTPEMSKEQKIDWLLKERARHQRNLASSIEENDIASVEEDAEELTRNKKELKALGYQFPKREETDEEIDERAAEIQGRDAPKNTDSEARIDEILAASLPEKPKEVGAKMSPAELEELDRKYQALGRSALETSELSTNEDDLAALRGPGIFKRGKESPVDNRSAEERAIDEEYETILAKGAPKDTSTSEEIDRLLEQALPEKPREPGAKLSETELEQLEKDYKALQRSALETEEASREAEDLEALRGPGISLRRGMEKVRGVFGRGKTAEAEAAQEASFESTEDLRAISPRAERQPLSEAALAKGHEIEIEESAQDLEKATTTIEALQEKLKNVSMRLKGEAADKFKKTLEFAERDLEQTKNDISRAAKKTRRYALPALVAVAGLLTSVRMSDDELPPRAGISVRMDDEGATARTLHPEVTMDDEGATVRNLRGDVRMDDEGATVQYGRAPRTERVASGRTMETRLTPAEQAVEVALKGPGGWDVSPIDSELRADANRLTNVLIDLKHQANPNQSMDQISKQAAKDAVRIMKMNYGNPGKQIM